MKALRFIPTIDRGQPYQPFGSKSGLTTNPGQTIVKAGQMMGGLAQHPAPVPIRPAVGPWGSWK